MDKYSKIYINLTKNLSPKIKSIFERRFGIKTGKPETLESIGKSLKITRERVRQIEEAGFNSIRKRNKETLEEVFEEINSYFNSKGGFKMEEVALAELGGVKNKPYILFFLAMGKDRFSRICGKKDYNYFWTINQDKGKSVINTLEALASDIERQKNLLTRDELLNNFASRYGLDSASLASCIEISKRIQQNKEGKFGLIEWPEINPRGIKDRAYLVFKKHQKPLHFRKVTELIDELEYTDRNGKKAHAQTVHNELIKDQRFVLVGRGIYALKDWGYFPGTIKDVIAKILKERQEGVLQSDLVKEVLAQRVVAKNTVLINLSNKKYFKKGQEGKYFLNDVKTA